MKRPELKELLDVYKFQDFFIWYYTLKEIGYTAEDFDKTADELIKEDPVTRYVIDVTIPYIIKAMDKAIKESENED